jgi:hypothetical protein
MFQTYRFLDHAKPLFGYSSIDLNLHVLRWIEV